jgi:hypothetical protein
MEPSDMNEESTVQAGNGDNVAGMPGSHLGGGAATNETTCPSCAGSSSMPPSYVYTLGRIEIRFPSTSVEREFVQAAGRTETAGLTDPEAVYKVLSEAHNRYLARQLCWVLSIEGLETYVLHPRDPADFSLLVEALRPMPRPTDVNLVIGTRGPLAPPEQCNGLTIPIVVFDQIYSFDVQSLIASIPRPENIPEEEFKQAAEEIFMRVMQMADNAGATDEHRALNYLTLRYPAIYAIATECHGRDCSLTAVDVRPSGLGGLRKVVDVICTYTNRKTDVDEKYSVRVDVSDKFPFLVTKMSPYYDR